LECNYEGSRSDKYLDVPLVIRGFGETEAVKSVEEALWKFVQPEILCGTNQFMCEKCNKKVDARKGLKFTKFPYVLMLQLKRFDYDFQLSRRVKLNDYVAFPDILNMNPYLNTDVPRRVQQEGSEPQSGMDIDNGQDELPKDAKRKLQLDKLLETGPNVYELYGVLVHRGSALGGHYYAYIRSFRDGKWLEFNDSSVSSVSDDRYKETFGETQSPSFYAGGTNAYMLLYRQYNPERNLLELSKEGIPEKITQIYEEDKKLQEEKKQEKERQKKLITCKIHYQDQMKSFEYHQDTPFEKLSSEVIEQFGLSSYWPQNVRLREYVTHNDLPGKTFPPEALPKTLNQLNFYYQKTLMIETKTDAEVFEQVCFTNPYSSS
jgi:ubiquitin carboxyl-terminal hydrolase 47